MLKDVLAAIQFATILPVGGDRFDPRAIVAHLPLAGLVVGLLLAIFDYLAVLFWSPPVAAALDVVFLAIISGALHLDGLADTVDGLYGGTTRERALEIMKDSRTGAMGVVAIGCCFLAKWAGLSDLPTGRFWLLVLVPAYARAGSMLGFRLLEYGRQHQGTALAFFQEKLVWRDFRWLLVLLLLSLLTGWKMLLINGGFLVVTALALMFYKHKMGCITGDMLGAMIEVTEAALFIAVAAA